MLRFGLLGTGYWAAETHAAGLRGHPDAEFVGVWGRNPAKAGTIAERYGVRAYSDVDALITDVDALAVALAPDVQADLARRAARAGRHLLLDKPVALSLSAADALVEAVDAAGVSALVFTTNRYRPEVAGFLADAAATGGWSGSRTTLYGAVKAAGSPYADSPWRDDKGGLWDLGPHALASIVPVLGPVVEVAAMTAPAKTHHVLARHAGGAVSTLHLSIHQTPAATVWETVLFGPAGAATLPTLTTELVDAFRAAVAHLVANAAAGIGDDPLDVHAGRDAVAVLVAAEQAATEGRTVPVPTRTPRPE
ncbi:MAG: Gfo/Idh/MocA family oxidoreductase [Actinobacteria bacterium]|nr:MAG: Gfo/Idh/MocA family oxidoreductase [Actinomycetota bacterium]